MKIMYKLLTESAIIPSKATTGAAGYDIYCDKEYLLPKRLPVLVSTGISLQIPEGFEGQIRSRSGLACKGIHVFNGVGTIDSDYRGEIKVLLMNYGEDFYIRGNSRIAQLVFNKIYSVEFTMGTMLATERNTNGFGSTGI